MIWRALSYFFFLAGIAGLCAAAYLYFLGVDGPGATIDEPNRDFPALAVGKNGIGFRLRNPTRHVVRVVGYQFC